MMDTKELMRATDEFTALAENYMELSVAGVSMAMGFAAAAHFSIGQLRKYSYHPYIEHPIRVMNLLIRHMKVYPITSELLAAAVLHDVIEDTPVTLHQIRIIFGADVAQLVELTSSVTKDSKENRATRKNIDQSHYATGDYRSQSIKVADSMDNAVDIAVNDPDFAVVFLREKRSLVEALTKADPNLRMVALDLITNLEANTEKNANDVLPSV